MSESYRFFKEFSCSTDGLGRYRIRFGALERPKGWRSSVREMVVERSQDGGVHWEPVSLRLSFWSKAVLWTSASPFWPPEVPIAMGCTEGKVWFDYVDAPDEEPRWMRKPAVWRAIYSDSEKQWRIIWLSSVGS